jgi:hypothetical protein
VAQASERQAKLTDAAVRSAVALLAADPDLSAAVRRMAGAWPLRRRPTISFARLAARPPGPDGSFRARLVLVVSAPTAADVEALAPDAMRIGDPDGPVLSALRKATAAGSGFLFAERVKRLDSIRRTVGGEDDAFELHELIEFLITP